MESYHTPVLLNEIIEYLNVQKGSWYVDATLGGGGHIKAILEHGGKVLGIDVDEDALSYVKTADVFVLNSAYEGLPHVVLEAMSYNIPVAISDVGGNPEILIPGKVGYLFPYNDKRAILQAIRAVLYDEERASSQQLVNWRHEFYPHYMVKSTKYILEKVCAN